MHGSKILLNICRTSGGNSGGKQTEIIEMTLRNYAGKSGGNYDTLYRKLRRIFPAEVWTAETELKPEHIRVLSGGKSGKTSAKRPTDVPADIPAKQVSVNQPEQAVSVPPARQNFKWPTFTISDFLALAIYGHTALVWYEVSAIFGLPGMLAGVVVFAMKHTAVVVVRNADYERFRCDSNDVLGVAFVLDLLAVWAHYTTFNQSIPANFRAQVGAEGVFWSSLVLAFIVALGAFMSLYFTDKTAKK